MLVLEEVGVRFGERAALDGVSLEVADGEVLSLLGPSGSGKTTLLRVVAGLEVPASGRILLDGRDLADIPAHRRGIGLMFQDFALFPHRDVGGNVAFGLRMQGLDGQRVAARVAEVLELVKLPGTERRSVATLSGGEQQRVALARALAPQPHLLMLDEPMGSLDRALRDRLPAELRQIFEAAGVTVIYVTHDQDEAFAVADRTAILRAGRIEARGSPEALWMRPPSAFVARFLGFRNVIEAEQRGTTVTSDWGTFEAPVDSRDGPVTLVLRPDAVGLDAQGPLSGTVLARRFRGDHVSVMVRLDRAPDLHVEVRQGVPPHPGDAVRLVVDPSGVVIVGPGEAALPLPRAERV